MLIFVLCSKTTSATLLCHCILSEWEGSGLSYSINMAFLAAQLAKNPPVNTWDTRDGGSVPGSGRFPRIENRNLLQYSCLKNSMDRGAWWATVHGSQRVGHDWASMHALFIISQSSVYPTGSVFLENPEHILSLWNFNTTDKVNIFLCPAFISVFYT